MRKTDSQSNTNSEKGWRTTERDDGNTEHTIRKHNKDNEKLTETAQTRTLQWFHMPLMFIRDHITTLPHLQW